MSHKCLSLIKVNIEELDKAHLEHAQLLTELSDAIESNTFTSNHVDEIMNSLKDHFEHEEELMESHHVPTLAQHKKEHKNMIYKFSNALHEIGKGDIAEKNLHVEHLSDLFLSHIGLWDSQYVPYLIKETT